jgi:hypothetical protein
VHIQRKINNSKTEEENASNDSGPADHELIITMKQNKTEET